MNFGLPKKQSRHYDVNRRTCYAMRRVGNGYSGMKKFLMLMNHPPPMTEKLIICLEMLRKKLVKQS